MKNSEKNKATPSGEKEELMDALLGTDVDLAVEECADEYLEAMDVDPSALTGEFAARLDREIEALHSAGQDSSRVTAALQSIHKQMKTPTPTSPADFEVRPTLPASARSGYWTNPSVFTLASGGAPVDTITREARKQFWNSRKREIPSASGSLRTCGVPRHTRCSKRGYPRCPYSLHRWKIQNRIQSESPARSRKIFNLS